MLRVPHKLEVLTTTKRQLRAQLLQFATELGHLLRGLPVHESGFAVSLRNLGLVSLAVNFTLYRPIGRKNFFHEARGKIHAGFNEHRVDNLVRATELGTTGGIVAQAGAPQAFLVQLIPLLAGFLVALDLLEQVGDDVLQNRLIDLFNDVGEVFEVTLLILVVLHPDDSATVFGILDLKIVLVIEFNHLAGLVVVIVFESVRHN